MSYPPGFIVNAEALWKDAKDVDAANIIVQAEQEASEDADKMLEYGRLLLRMRRLSLLISTLRRALVLFPDDHRLPDLLVDVFFEIGDADSALEVYSLAKARGLPPQSHAIRRVTRVAIWCGRLDELQAVLEDPASSEFEAESHSMLSQERVAHSHFEGRRRAELGNKPPSVIDIRNAATSGSLPYASHLYTMAATSTSINCSDLLAIAYNVHPTSGNVPCKLAFMAWRLLKRLPSSSPAKIFVAAYCLLQNGDAYGAQELLEDALRNSDGIQFPVAADLTLQLATSCSVFGAMPERRVPEISGELWHALNRKE